MKTHCVKNVSLSFNKLFLGIRHCPAGIFQPHIHFLLVLATPVDVVILGLSFPKAQTGECLFLYRFLFASICVSLKMVSCYGDFLHFLRRVKRQHVGSHAAPARPAVLHPHGQHLHAGHHLDRPGTHLPGRKGRLPVRNRLPGRSWMVQSALQEDQPLQEQPVFPYSISAAVLLL